jgi:hypothetical protein
MNDAKYGYEHQYLPNMLHIHNGFINGDMIPYSELGQKMGLHQTEWSWSPLFADYDNDGDKDLFVTNGYPRDMTDKDWAVSRSKIADSNTTPQDIINKMPAVRVPNCAFENEGDIIFSKRYSEWFEQIPSFSYGAAYVDLDGDGDQDVIALAGGYENKEDEYIHYLYENNQGSFSRTPLPTTPFPASVVRPVDFDRDGDMDLFIGARIGLEIFPFSENSWFLFNDNGRYTSENSLNFFLGMVTDAIWSDYDGDGWEDLLVTREWNTVALLKNLNGERIQFHKFPEIESMHGIWYSVAAADFDLDGDEDFVLGNLGDNHRFTVSAQYPMNIYALDMDLNGTLDPISTAYWKDPDDVMREFPIHYFDELMSQSPYFLSSVDSYTSFSYITIEEILHPGLMNRVDYTLQANTTSSYILWNNKGSFTWERLPELTQVSPIKKILVKDLNLDSYPDVILAGNDHTYDVSRGYYDANKGLILMSKNNKPLSDLLKPSETGLMLHGMVESLLYLEGDETLIVAGLNRDSLRVFSIPD